MNAIAASLAPVLVLIFLGFLLRRARFLPEITWPAIEKLTYFILFPALLVGALGNQTLTGTPWPAMLGGVVGTMTVAVVALVSWHSVRPSVDGPVFTSIFQGGVRYNSYIALAVAEGFFGAEGLAFGAIAAGFIIVFANISCVSALAIWGNSGANGTKAFVRDVAGNPLILACATGWFLSLSGIGVPGLAAEMLEFVGRAALPFGLIAVGAALRLEALRGHLLPIAVSSSTQFVLKPLVATVLISVTGLAGVPAGVLYICMMVPTASSAVILARQLGGDAESMASIITFQTLLAFAVMPAIAMIVLT